MLLLLQGTPSRANSITGDRPPRPRASAEGGGSLSARRAGSMSARSEGSEAHRPRGFASELHDAAKAHQYASCCAVSFPSADPPRSGAAPAGTGAATDAAAAAAAGGEELDTDDWPLGSVEEMPRTLRVPGASMAAAFVSDRQKLDTASEDAILTKIVTGAVGGRGQ